MTLNSSLQLAAYCILVACAVLPRLRLLRKRLAMRPHRDRVQIGRNRS